MPLPTHIFLYPQNTQVISITELQDAVTGAFLNSATVSATLVDRLGNVDAVLNNISLAYVPASNGGYQGTVPFTFNAEIGGGYTLQVTAFQGGVQSFFSFNTTVQLRRQ